jgi:ubiquinone/menaquinone biosynthesis C-methylase UbiE
MRQADAPEKYSTARYDRIAPHYDSALRPLDRWFLARLRAKVFQYLPDDGRILELGAGTGRNFGFYSDYNFIVATEPSREMLRVAETKKRPGAVKLIQCTAEHLPFADNSFDAAFATLVFCSLADPAAAFSELRRVIKNGGVVVLLEHVRPLGLLGPVFDLLNLATVPLCDDHFNRRTADDAKRNGMELVKLERSLLGIMNLIICRVR